MNALSENSREGKPLSFNYLKIEKGYLVFEVKTR